MNKLNTHDEINYESLELGWQNEQNLKALINNFEDFCFFINRFWTETGEQMFAISDFREFKIKQRNMDLKEFEEIYKENKKRAFKELFQEHIFEDNLKKIIKKIERNNITLEEIYKKFRKDLLHHGRFAK
ncbi:hypothetical protein B7C51_24915 (plasmid) [Paenibacillus larvae subsp. pulvifaciens]|uniref:Uncharacterized protein n=1 Tax=Paenibacillus larvae subsp. pulvifaciens TaxID=1477 RepID=A0A1V0V089_9BACL|nr:hypothetical protein [Paenibacillus larvae]ARF70718.1 hypothetical protein B7C51_24915 [Paenibacillus larvae subsp. pulvifaciens]